MPEYVDRPFPPVVIGLGYFTADYPDPHGGVQPPDEEVDQLR
jgi:hypothetical protein